MRRTVIIGAGQAGGRAAVELRARGHDGSITLIGDDPALPYERPPLSKDVLLGIAEVGDAPVNPPAAYVSGAIDLRLGSGAAAIDVAAREVRVADGSRLGFDEVVVATGARPRRLAVPGGEAAGCHYLHTASEAVALRAALAAGAGHLVVVGGGFTGLEVAASARARGWAVTVVEQADTCLGRVMPPRSADAILDIHRDHGVAVRCATQVAAIDTTGAGLVVRLRDGAPLAADLVVVGIGSVPNCEIAAAAGIVCAGGIVVDAAGRTSTAGIYAIGDVAVAPNDWFGGAVRLESWDNAERQATRLACILMGQPPPPEPPPWFWTDQHGVNIQVIGVPAADDALVVRRGRSTRQAIHFYLRDGQLAGAVLFDSGRERRTLTQLVTAGRRCSAAALGDATIDLRALAADSVHDARVGCL